MIQTQYIELPPGILDNIFMYVCTYVRMYECVCYVCTMSIHMNTCICINVCMYMYVYKYVCMYVCMYDVCVYACMYVCMYIFVCTCMRICIYHVCMYVCM